MQLHFKQSDENAQSHETWFALTFQSLFLGNRVIQVPKLFGPHAQLSHLEVVLDPLLDWLSVFGLTLNGQSVTRGICGQ